MINSLPRLGFEYLAEGNLEDARREFNNFLGAVPPDEEGRQLVNVGLALANLQTGDWAASEKLFQEALAQPPEEISEGILRYYLSKTLYALGRLEEADQEICLAISLNDNVDYDHYLTAGAIQYRLDKYEEAEALFKKALKLSPPPYHRYLTHIYLGLSQVGQAYEQLTKCKRPLPEHFKALNDKTGLPMLRLLKLRGGPELADFPSTPADAAAHKKKCMRKSEKPCLISNFSNSIIFTQLLWNMKEIMM
jgi:tetratricopeptide (TPR) repeat protein